MYGQLTLIAGRDGPVGLKCHDPGRELDVLDEFRNVWRPDLKVEVLMIAELGASKRVLDKLRSKNIGGYLYRRDAVKQLLNLVSQETSGAELNREVARRK